MSNTSTNYAELNVTNDDMKEMLAEGTFQPVAEQKAAPVKKKNVGYRILALILTIAPIVCLCLINITLIISTTSGYAVYDKSTLLNAVMSLFKKDGLSEFYKKAAEVVTGAATSGFDSYKFMGLPVLSGTGTIGKLMGLVLYAMPAAMVVTVVLMIIALCSGKAAPAMTRAIAFINFWVYGGYALCVLAVSLYYANIEKTFDVVVLAIAGAFFLLYHPVFPQSGQAHVDDVASLPFDGGVCRRLRVRYFQVRGRLEDSLCFLRHLVHQQPHEGRIL